MAQNKFDNQSKIFKKKIYSKKYQFEDNMRGPFRGLELLVGTLHPYRSFGALHNGIEGHVSILFDFIQGCHVHLK